MSKMCGVGLTRLLVASAKYVPSSRLQTLYPKRVAGTSASLVVSFVSAMVLFGSCGTAKQEPCHPGASRSCACAHEGSGTQACLTNAVGSFWSKCDSCIPTSEQEPAKADLTDQSLLDGATVQGATGAFLGSLVDNVDEDKVMHVNRSEIEEGSHESIARPTDVRNDVPKDEVLVPASHPAVFGVSPGLWSSSEPKWATGASISTRSPSRVLCSSLASSGLISSIGNGQAKGVYPVTHDIVLVVANSGAFGLELSTGRRLWEINCPTFSGVASADYSMIALIREDKTTLWDLSSNGSLGEKPRQFKHRSSPHTTLFHPTHRLLGLADYFGTLEFYNVDTGVVTSHTETAEGVRSLRMNPNGHEGAVRGLTSVTLWDFETAKSGSVFDGFHHDYGYGAIDLSVRNIQFSTDGKWIGVQTDSGFLHAWSLSNGVRKKWTNAGAPFYVGSSGIVATTTSSGSEQKRLAFLPYRNDSLSVESEDIGSHGLVDLSSDKDEIWLYAATDEGNLLRLDRSSLKEDERWQILSHPTGLTALSPDGSLAAYMSGGLRPTSAKGASGHHGPLVMWDLDENVARWRLQDALPAKRGSELAAISPGNRYYAHISPKDGGSILSIWSIEEGKELHRIGGLYPYPSSISFKANGEVIAAAQTDPFSRRGARVSFWNTRSGRKLGVTRNLLSKSATNGNIRAMEFLGHSERVALLTLADGLIVCDRSSSGKKCRQVSGYDDANTLVSYPTARLLGVSGFRETAVLDAETLEAKLVLSVERHSAAAVPIKEAHPKTFTYGKDVLAIGVGGDIAVIDLSSGIELRRLRGLAGAHLQTASGRETSNFRSTRAGVVYTWTTSH